MPEADEADRDDILDAIDRSRRARALFRRGDTPAAMSALASASLRSATTSQPLTRGIRTRSGPASTRTPRFTYELFVFVVFDPRGPAGPVDAMAALAARDRANRAAFVEWPREPWRR